MHDAPKREFVALFETAKPDAEGMRIVQKPCPDISKLPELVLKWEKDGLVFVGVVRTGMM